MQGLYRGKRIDNGEWVYGDLLQDGDTDAFIATRYTAYSDGFCQVFGEPVHAETVGQSTGLPDKNGKYIYKGDIFKARYDVLVVVEWDADCARFLGFTIEKERKIVYIGQEPAVEVIGNRWDNPELLGVR
ncbi:MAG: hypothetical protein K0Q85_2 [Caproiciproducens sp.]|nr:hypothetical protein [Caproiciproducens sp.]